VWQSPQDFPVSLANWAVAVAGRDTVSAAMPRITSAAEMPVATEYLWNESSFIVEWPMWERRATDQPATMFRADEGHRTSRWAETNLKFCQRLCVIVHADAGARVEVTHNAGGERCAKSLHEMSALPW
jgi:hypothetical protein